MARPRAFYYEDYNTASDVEYLYHKEEADIEFTHLERERDQAIAAAQQSRKDALEEAAAECDMFVEAYSFYESYPAGYTYTPAESKAAMVFAQGRFRVVAEKIRALTAKESQEGK